MAQNELKLSKDLGDIGDQLSEKPIYIYHIPKVKIGSAYNVSKRVRAQGYDIDDVEILWTIPPHTMSLNHIWRTEQLEARLRGYDDEHNGNRIAVNRVRATGGINSSREYILTEVETGEEVFVSDAAEFEARYKLTPTIISRAANPNQQQRYVTVDDTKFTARYAD